MAENSHIHAIDSLSANEFEVELEGKPVSGIFRVSGLVTFKLDDNHKLIREPLLLSKMVQRDPGNPMNRWVTETRNAGEAIGRPTHKLTIVAVDDGLEVRRWVVHGAWIKEVRYSEFNRAESELVEEILMIHYDTIEEIYTLNRKGKPTRRNRKK